MYNVTMAMVNTVRALSTIMNMIPPIIGTIGHIDMKGTIRYGFGSWKTKNPQSFFDCGSMAIILLSLHLVKTVNDNEPSVTAEGLGSGIPNNMTSARK